MPPPRVHLLVLGLNHRSAPVEMRERLAFGRGELEEALNHLRRLKGVHEGVLLSTCNRVEIYAAVEDLPAGAQGLRNFLAQSHGVPLASFEGYLYVHGGRDAIHHLFRVASGLDSMVVGEPQILGQLKEAYAAASTLRAPGVLLNRFLHQAFRVAKRVRSETRVAHFATSVASIAVELARKIFGELRGRDVLLLGAGEMSELAARYFRDEGAGSIRVASRTLERAEELARAVGGAAFPYEEFPQGLKGADIVVVSTGAPHVLVGVETAEAALRARKGKPIFFIDLSVPRNVAPEINRQPNAYVYDIDDLQQVAEENRALRAAESERAEEIVEEETGRFLHWINTLDAFPTIAGIVDQSEEIRKREVQRWDGRLKRLPPGSREVVDRMSAALVKKLLHTTLSELKRASENGDGYAAIAAARRLFGLEGGEPPEGRPKRPRRS